jgi:phospholipid/cholesterol/gamma-HCH transport system substrate-binding protein
MPGISQAAKVGAFTVLTAGAGFYIHDFVTHGAGSDEGYHLYALMDNASGVVKHSQVRIAGIPVGTIENVSLQGKQARVDIRMDPDVPLYVDGTVSKVSSSLLGEYTIVVAPGTEGRDRLKEGDQIRVFSEGASTDDILLEVREIARDLKQVSSSLANSLGTPQGEKDLKEILHNLAQATDALNQTVRENRGSIHSILTRVDAIAKRSEPEVERILENVRDTTKDVRAYVEKSNDPNVPSGEVHQVIERVNRASVSMEKALADIEVVTDRLEKGEGTLGRLSKDERLINEVEGIAEGIGDFVGGFSRLRTIVNLRTDYQFLTGTLKSFVEIRLQPREDKYYSFEVISDPRGYTTVEQVDVSTTNPNDPPHYREVRTVTKNDFRFSFQFAQRMGPFWGRFGIKESTGGVGLDTVLFNDRLELRQDLFGFGEAPLPRYRVFLGYEFLHRMWLLGGVDDILSNDRRDYFIGLQLRFDDQDLKSLLPFAGGAVAN